MTVQVQVQVPTQRALVVEGVECAGKTTLIREFRDSVVNWDIKSLSHQPGRQFDRFMCEYVSAHGLILNRAHVSELVYARLWDRGRPFSDAERDVLDDYAARHFTLVLCTADQAVLERRYAERGFNQRAKVAELPRITEFFDEECERVPHIRYVSSGPDALAKAISDIRRSLSLSAGHGLDALHPITQ